jgi:surfeit locus 1 family protein
MKKAAFAVLAVVGVVLFSLLGAWQLQRREWKHELISRVQQRVTATPIAAPNNHKIDPRAYEYRKVSVQGRFLNDRETLVQAATQLGGGFWVMTPLRTDWGFTVLVNRGFVPTGQRQTRNWSRVEGEVMVTGLLRLDEPGGGFLRDNQPGQDRWYSRDVTAIARARGLVGGARYFIDADATSVPGAPVGGLTVVTFTDNHLQYALTWFALALLLAVGALRILRA